MRFDDGLRRRLDAHDQLFRSLQRHKDLLSVDRSYEHLQRSIDKLTLATNRPETERLASQMAALVRDSETAMGGVHRWIRQLDRDGLMTTYQIGAKMAHIEHEGRTFSPNAGLTDSIATSSAKVAREWRTFDSGMPGVFRAATRAMELVAGLNRLTRQNLPGPDLYSQLLKSSAMEQLPALRAARAAILLPEFDTTFLGSLHRRLEQLYESGVTLEPAMAEVDSAIKERADHLPQSWVNFRGMLDVLYPLLLVLFQLWYAKVSEERSSTEMQRFIESQFRAAETHLALQIHGLKPSSSREMIRVIERQCYLHADRFAKATTIGVLYPNQLVEVHRTSGKWAYIEFFDYVNAIPKTGWILKKYVTTIDLSPRHVERPQSDPEE